MAQATVLATAKIDVSPLGISITFEGLDKDLSDLLASAKSFEAKAPEYRTYDTSDVVIKSRKEIQFMEPTVIEVTTEPTTTGDSTTP